MGLSTDAIFVAAIKSDDELMGAIGGRLYGTAVPLPDEDADNVPVPYVIVTFDGLTNDAQTKDCPYEGDFDSVNIGVEVTAASLAALHELTQKVRTVVLGYMESEDTTVRDYQLTAGPIQYDQLKPCYWQVLRYQCDVEIIQEDEDGQDEED